MSWKGESYRPMLCLIWRRMGRRGWALTQYPRLLVHLEPRSLELLDDPLGELAAGIIRGVFSKESA
jgi:hypothetical protein